MIKSKRRINKHEIIQSSLAIGDLRKGKESRCVREGVRFWRGTELGELNLYVLTPNRPGKYLYFMPRTGWGLKDLLAWWGVDDGIGYASTDRLPSDAVEVTE